MEGIVSVGDLLMAMSASPTVNVDTDLVSQMFGERPIVSLQSHGLFTSSTYRTLLNVANSGSCQM